MKERDKQILQDYEHGVKLMGIARRHGVSVATVNNVVRRYGKLSRKVDKTPENVKQTVLNLLAQGIKAPRIAELTGLSESTIYRFKKEVRTINVVETPPYAYPPQPKNYAGLIALAAGLALIIVLLLVLAN